MSPHEELSGVVVGFYKTITLVWRIKFFVYGSTAAWPVRLVGEKRKFFSINQAINQASNGLRPMEEKEL